MREFCEALEHENSDAEKELAKFRANADALGSLQKEVDQYGRLSILTAQIDKLKASLVDGYKRYKKVSEDMIEAYQAFEADRKYLQHRKDDRTNALKVLEEKVVVAR